MAHRRAEPTVLLTHYQSTLDMYMNEIRSIRESLVISTSSEHLHEEQQQELLQQPYSQGASARGSGGTDTEAHDSSEEEENDHDQIFLDAAGFGSVIDDLQRQVDSGVNSDDSGELDSHTEGLPQSHARLIKKRVNTLRSTLKQKKSQEGEGASRGDVRDIFGDRSGQETTNHVASSYKSINYLSPAVAMARPEHGCSATRPILPPKPKIFPALPFPSPNSVVMPTTSSKLPREQPTSAVATTPSYEVHKTLGQSSSSSELLDLSTSRRRSESDGAANMKSYQSSPILAKRKTPGQLLGGGRRSPKSANNSDNQDIKLHFGVGSPVKGAASGITENLPRYTICPEPLGVAQTTDISPHEQSKVRSLALLELQITFDEMGLPLRLRRPLKHKNLKEKGVFGVPLTTLLEQDHQRAPNTQIPLIFSEILEYLESEGLQVEGLLRVPGSATRIKAIIDKIETKFHCGVFSLKSYMANKKDCKVTDIASLLKQFIRQLPIPLLTRQYLSTFASIADILDLKEQVRTLNLLILVLPEPHQKVLKRLLEFFRRVMDHSSQNKMTLTNIAMVIAPNLFTNLPTRQNMDDVTMAAKTSHVVRLLINYHELLWTVPADLLRQVRYLNECEVKRVNQRSLQKAMRQVQDREPVLKKSTSYTVPIYGPLYLCVRKMIHFTCHTTAEMVLEKFEHSTHLNKDLIRKRFSSNIQTGEARDSFDPAKVAGKMFLHEVGGNIVERCLPPETNMYLLYETNPQTVFVIKPRNCPDILPVKTVTAQS